MRPSFDIEALRTMVLGSELGSFARAAIQLGRSQSAVSMQLKRLEEQAGHALFQRSGRGLVPTEAVTVSYRGAVVATGHADAEGRFVTRVRVGKKAGRRAVVARGQFPSLRSGRTVIRVVR